MDIAALLTNEELRRREFPVCAGSAFLAHAGVSPLPRRVAEAMQAYTEACTQGDQEDALPAGFLEALRGKAERLLGAEPGEVALVGPTTLGLSYVAGGLSFRKGENVLVYFDDYPSNVYPWLALADRGVEVRLVNTRELGRVRYPEVLGMVDDDTRLVALASGHFISGHRLECEKIGRALRERGVLFCVDGIQTLGAFPMSVEFIDFLAADGHKWLLGPGGAGILYVRRAAQKILKPVAWGWNNVLCPNYVAQEDLVYHPDARKYEAGTGPLVGLAGLSAALDLLLETGVGRIAAELLRKRQRLVPALQAKGYEVLGAGAAPETMSGIVSFFKANADMGALHRRLLEGRVVTSLRADRTGRQYIRLSPHFYNTDAELDRALELIQAGV